MLAPAIESLLVFIFDAEAAHAKHNRQVNYYPKHYRYFFQISWK